MTHTIFYVPTYVYFLPSVCLRCPLDFFLHESEEKHGQYHLTLTLYKVKFEMVKEDLDEADNNHTLGPPVEDEKGKSSALIDVHAIENLLPDFQLIEHYHNPNPSFVYSFLLDHEMIKATNPTTQDINELSKYKDDEGGEWALSDYSVRVPLLGQSSNCSVSSTDTSNVVKKYRCEKL